MMRRLPISVAVLLAVAGLTTAAYATHSWGGYHWARTSNPFTLSVGDNVSAVWDAHLDTSVTDWSVSDVLNLNEVAGGTNPKNCRPKSGRIEVCNSKYGNNGWLGIASVWVSGTHITQATAKLNDTYFNKPQYNTPAWRNLVMCQEIAHGFGLDHQDEIFDNPNLGTCMDYTSNPESNQHPNQHDYDMLEEIYAHLDLTSTIGQTAQKGAPSDLDLSDPGSWGREVRRSADGHASVFERNLGNGNKVITHVFWAEPRGR